MEACKITGCSYRQIEYWCRTGLIRPDFAQAAGSGSQRRYSVENVRDVAMLYALRSVLHHAAVHRHWESIQALIREKPMPEAIEIEPGIHILPAVILAAFDAR